MRLILRFLLIVLVLVSGAARAPAQVPSPQLAPDPVFTDAAGRVLVRVTLNASVSVNLLYQEDLPYVVITRQLAGRLKIPLKNRPSAVVRVAGARLKVKTFLLERVSIGDSSSEGIDAAVIVAGNVPPAIVDGAVGKRILDRLKCVVEPAA